mmetsp:Transcript_28999/g.74551  ORF Transcript_28999/g.74551 Transcript_28999/m.74551 type:complete len:305 (+) Transcript_28999:38-952(+)
MGPDEESDESKIKVSTDISHCFWVHGALLGLASIALPLVLSIYVSATGGDVEQQPTHLWWEVTGPAIALLIIELIVGNVMAPVLAFQLLKERSSIISIKETLRGTLLAQFNVSALLLLVTIMLIAGESPTDDNDSRVAQWYSCQLIITLMCSVLGLVSTFFYLIFIQPLSDSVTLVFVSSNMMYFGESMSFSILGVCSLLCACVLWLLGRHGVSVAVVGCCAVFYTCTRMVVIYSYFSSFQNPEMSAEARRERQAWGMQYATTGKNNLTMKANQTRIRDQRRYVNEALDGHGVALAPGGAPRAG